mgnify:CR=1 FL=1|jgi:hypothetical protein
MYKENLWIRIACKLTVKQLGKVNAGLDARDLKTRALRVIDITSNREVKLMAIHLRNLIEKGE